MSAILEGTPDKRLVLVTGRAYPELAEKVAECLGTEILETTSYDFANGEMYVRFTEPCAVRTCSCCSVIRAISTSGSWNSSS